MLKNIFFVLICCSSFINAQPKSFKLINDEAEFRKKFNDAANIIQTIKCDFVQEKNLNVLSEKIISKGTFLFKKQSMVKMEYVNPFKYLLVINKEKVMIKDEQKTITVSAKSNMLFEHINKIIIDCVQGTAMNNKDFSMIVSENEKQYLLTLRPLKKDLQEFFSTISIYIEKNDYSVHKMDMIEPSGDNTVITFVNKQFNVDIPDEVFAIK